MATTISLTGRLADIMSRPIDSISSVTVKAPSYRPGPGVELTTSQPTNVELDGDGEITIEVVEGIGWIYIEGAGWSDSIRFVAAEGMTTIWEAVVNALPIVIEAKRLLKELGDLYEGHRAEFIDMVATAVAARDDAQDAADAAGGYRDSAATSAALAEGSASKASTFSKFADNRATRAEDLSEDAIRRVEALEVLAGFTPGDVPDATIASTVETDGLARAAIVNAIADDSGVVGSPVWQALQAQRIAPSLSPLSELAQPFGTAAIQEPDGTIYQYWTRTGSGHRLQKSVDGGLTWEDRGALPGVPNAWIKLYTGTIIAVEQASTTTPGGSNPRVWRSTNDGGSWAEVPAGLNFGPLGSQGISEGTDGSVMIAEYGNIGNFSYRVRRSTDDGQTWSTVFTTSGLEPQGDPGHIHSLTYDHVAGKHVIFVDRPIFSTWGGPHVYASSDNGATWEFVGESDTVDKPNFVAPMYFENYIAWGSDNQINGRISRISRDDFYAGRFETAETVAQLSQKAMYHTFPLRPDVWAVSMALEHIPSSAQDGEPGSMMHEVWLVSQDGALVTGGMESYYRAAGTSNLVGVRTTFPARRFDIVDHHGLVWANMPTTIPRAYTAVPATQGYEPPIKRFESIVGSYKFGSILQFEPELGVGDKIPIAARHTSSYAHIGNGIRAHIRILSSGDMQIRYNQQLLASVNSSGFIPGGGKILFASNNTFIQAAAGSPKGTVAANPGSIYLEWNGAAVSPVWVKRAGTGVDGWEKLGHPAGSTNSRPVNPEVGESFFDTNLGKPIWRASTGWVDANGQPV